MNSPTQNLKNDHEYIRRLTDVMERMVMSLATEAADMETVVNLITNYAYGFHHAKEENILFPFLLQKGFSTEHGPVSIMLHDHAEGRRFLKGMVIAIARYKAGDDTVLPLIYANMGNYVELIRAHIGKENNVLFKMADRILTATEQEQLLQEFEAVEANDYGKEKIGQFIAEIEGLESIYRK
jgi:hemerythrin-like domain-containing protein